MTLGDSPRCLGQAHSHTEATPPTRKHQQQGQRWQQPPIASGSSGSGGHRSCGAMGRRPMRASAAAACSLLVLHLATLAVVVRGQLVIKRNQQDCVAPAVDMDGVKLWPSRAYLPTQTTVRALPGGFIVESSAGFTIEYRGTYKVITNKLAGERYVMYTCGSGPPTGVPNVAKYFAGPLVSVSVNDGGAADFVAQLLLMDRIAFATDLSVSGCLQALAGCGYLAPDTYNSEDLDKIKGRVDAYLTYAASSNLQTIAFSAPAAKSPLERAKWLQYVGALYNKEDAANRLYVAIRDSYNKVRQQVRSLLQSGGTPKPRVCWVFLDYEGDFAMSFADYKVVYIQDAGGQMYDPAVLTGAGMVAKPPGSTTTYVFKAATTDLVVKWGGVLALCDIIIDESYEAATGGITTMDLFLETHGLTDYADQIPAVSAARVYTIAGTTGMPVTTPGSFNLGSVGLDWFERGTSRPDEVLRDFVRVITPALTTPEVSAWSLRWLLRLDGQQQQQRVPVVCSLPTAKLDATCRRTTFASRICPNAIRNCDTGVMQYPVDASKRCLAVSVQDRTKRQRRKQGLPECADAAP